MVPRAAARCVEDWLEQVQPTPDLKPESGSSMREKGGPILMADVKPRRSSAGAAKRRKQHPLPAQRADKVAGTTQAPRRKELDERAALALFDQAQRLDGVVAATHEAGT